MGAVYSIQQAAKNPNPNPNAVYRIQQAAKNPNPNPNAVYRIQQAAKMFKEIGELHVKEFQWAEAAGSLKKAAGALVHV